MAHLSPETGGADVWVTPAGGTASEFAHDVTYGETTKYATVPAGTYAVSMHPTGVTTGKPLLAGNLTLAAWRGLHGSGDRSHRSFGGQGHRR